MSAPRASVKLRSACDACSAAKVKCDKAQPICDRCRLNGSVCLYSPSQRHGQQSWAKRLAEQQRRNSAMQTPLAATPLSTTTPLMAPALLSTPPLPQANDGLGYALTPPDPEHMMDMDGGDRQGANYSSLVAVNSLADANSHALGDGSALGDGLDFLSPWSIEDTRMLNGSRQTLTPTTSPKDSATPTSRNTPQPQVHDCEAKAFKVLHSLHFCTILHTETPQSCIMFGDMLSNMPSLDKVLYRNRLAISSLKELLNCPCAQQPHLALLYTTIVSKTLFWYRLAVSPQYHSMTESDILGSPGNTTNSGLVTPVSMYTKTSAGRAVKSTPIHIGAFDLEEEDQKILLRGVLLREVRKLDALVDRMKTLGEEYSKRDGSADDEHQIPDWYRVTGAKIKAEVQDTLKWIKEFGVGRNGARGAWLDT